MWRVHRGEIGVGEERWFRLWREKGMGREELRDEGMCVGTQCASERENILVRG